MTVHVWHVMPWVRRVATPKLEQLEICNRTNRMSTRQDNYFEYSLEVGAHYWSLGAGAHGFAGAVRAGVRQELYVERDTVPTAQNTIKCDGDFKEPEHFEAPPVEQRTEQFCSKGVRFGIIVEGGPAHTFVDTVGERLWHRSRVLTNVSSMVLKSSSSLKVIELENVKLSLFNQPKPTCFPEVPTLKPAGEYVGRPFKMRLLDLELHIHEQKVELNG